MKITTILVLSLLFLAGCVPNTPTAQIEETNIETEPLMEEKQTETGAVTQENQTKPETATEENQAAPDTVTKEVTEIYSDYSEEKFIALKGKEKFVLFFHASWCPTCRGLDSDIEENSNELANAKILKANYDKETKLKKQYEIRVQHTVVFFDQEGNVTETIIGASIEDIIKFFKS